MAKLLLTISCFSILQYQVLSQFISRSIEQPRNFVSPPYPLVESPYNTYVPISPTVSAPGSTTIITDCSPTACKNLANTLQLMIVSNLLQNTNGGSELALQLAAPIINELFTSPTLSCGCVNPFAVGPSVNPLAALSPSVVAPSVVSPSVVSPNIYTSLLNNPNLISSLAGALSTSPGVLNYF